MTKNTAVNSKAYEYLQSLVEPRSTILDIEVIGKWLRATIASKASSGCYFSVRNDI